MARWLLLVLLIPLASLNANAVIETYEFSSPELEVRYKALSQELRCPKCQNQNIADSNAPISRDLRAIVHEQLEAGVMRRLLSTWWIATASSFATDPVSITIPSGFGLRR